MHKHNPMAARSAHGTISKNRYHLVSELDLPVDSFEGLSVYCLSGGRGALCVPINGSEADQARVRQRR